MNTVNIVNILKQKPVAIRYNDLQKPVQNVNLGEEEKELAEGEELEEGETIEERQTQSKPLSEILMDQRESEERTVNRKNILDVLKQNKILVVYCEDPNAFPVEPSVSTESSAPSASTSPSSETEFPVEDLPPTKQKLMKESIQLEEDDDMSVEPEQLQDQDQEPVQEEPIREAPFPSKNDNFESIETDSSTVFIVCANTKVAPGKAAKENIVKNSGESYTELSKIQDWRAKLCNTYETPFELDGQMWSSVDHYLIASKYRNQESQELKAALISSYKKALEIDKKKKFEKLKLTVDSDYESRKKTDEYNALYEKFSQDTTLDLEHILFLTIPAKLMYRPSSQVVEDYDVLMWLRHQMTSYLRYKYGRPGAALPQKEPVKRQPKNKALLEKISAVEVDLESIKDKIPQRESLVLRAPSYYMNNRTAFFGKLKTLFSKHELARKNGDKYKDSDDLFVHQRVVMDYLSTYSPYRGLLIYHGLGSGKTYTSISIAEGLKEDNDIVIMLPASLHTNYTVEMESYAELEDFGDPLFKRNQNWEFLQTEGKPEMIKLLSQALKLPETYVIEKKGAWMVDVQKPANFDTYPMEQQEMIKEQISMMVQNKYKFVHYNAGRALGTRIEELVKAKKGTKNPFDNCTVIIDEAHNFISNIKNNLKDPKAITTKIYKMLMDAENARIVLLSGTPVVNHPYEMGIIYNILRGTINTWEFTLEQNTTAKVDTLFIEKLLDKHNLLQYDYIDYARGKLTITRNPFGFSNASEKQMRQPQPVQNKTQKLKGGFTISKTPKNKSRTSKTKLPSIDETLNDNTMKGGSSENYMGVLKDGSLTNKEFVQQITKRLNENGLEVKKTKSVHYSALPDKEKEFQTKFVKPNSVTSSDAVTNRNVLHKRILGLTSYFRSPKEGLLPDFVLNEDGQEYHEIRVPMSNEQFETYAEMRTEEIKMEKNAKLKENMMKQKLGNNHEVLQATGSYRSSTRLCSNYFIPKDPGRPRALDFHENDENENANEDASDKNKKDLYKKDIERVTNIMSERKTDFFSKEALKLYSPKYLEILNRVQDRNNRGPHLLYSDFLNLEGIMFFKFTCDANGMRELKIEKYSGGWRLVDYDTPENAGKPAYITYTGNEDPEVKEIARNIYNGLWEKVPDEIASRLKKVAPNNMYGDIAKMIMITKAGAEGINLKNTRFVHIMEPYWHKTRTDQVIGRARRIGSHLELPQDMRNVQVFLYLSVFSESQMKGDQYKELMDNDVSKLDSNRNITTDEYLYEIAQMKQKIIDQFLHIIKESAMDCRLYRESHNKTEKVPLVCYGNTKDETTDYLTHPRLETDIENEPRETKKAKAPTQKATLVQQKRQSKAVPKPTK